MSMLLLRNAHVFAPDDLGKQDILISGETIVAVAPDIALKSSLPIQEIDCRQAIVCPGFVDTLTHITGGGGEGGFATRTPEMQVSDAILGGVTTVTGALGTDAVCRTHYELVAKVKALREEGLSAWFYTGNYHYPVRTLTGSIQQDLLLIDECIGIGEIAIADHRGSQLSWREMARVASDARVGGMCAGKAGIVSVHVGAGDDRLATLFDVAEHSNIPLSQFYPTHINRSEALLNEAVRFAGQGGTFDLTASSTPEILAAGELKCAHALKRALAAGVNADQVTFSTDGHASLPHFNSKGILESLKVGSMTSLIEEVQDAVAIEKLPLSTVLKAVTANPARVLKLAKKGHIRPHADADLLLLDPENLALTGVMARGQWFMQDSQIIKVGTFE